MSAASDFDITTTGKISLVEAKPGTRGVDKQQVYVSVTLDDPNLAAELSGASVRVTIPIDSTAGEVLTVPVSAVTTKANGETSVLVQDGSTTPRGEGHHRPGRRRRCRGDRRRRLSGRGRPGRGQRPFLILVLVVILIRIGEHLR